MTGDEFVAALRRGLKGLPAREADDIVADYRNHFAEGIAAGRSEAEVAAALGDPSRLARELRAEAGLRAWEARRSPGAFLRAIVALFGLAALDLFVLVPVMFVAAVSFFAAGVALLAVTVAGLALMAGLADGMPFAGWPAAAARFLAGLGLLSGGIGWGAALLLLLGVVLKLLARYARLHYRLISPATQGG
jgi:uncharacterized membrane protein